MRIIGGEHKGRRLTPPKNLPVRPTTDMNRESLFNILNHMYEFKDLKVLDLFAGTGAISYEFSSRGASRCVAVDRSAACTRYIDKVAAELDFPIETITGNVFTALEKLRGSFDIIFADPPYGLSQQDWDRLADQCLALPGFVDEGTLIIESSKHTKYDDHPALDSVRKYGGTRIWFFEKRETDL